MTNAKRGRGSRRGAYFCTVAALSLTLSACGGGPAGGASPAASDGNPPPVSTSPPPVSTNPPTGSVTLNWMPPTENTNGTPLTDLAGYDIHYGSMSEDYAQTISISNPGIATYVVDNLPSGVYYFTVTSVNTAGTESQLSSEVKATVN